MAKNRFQLTGKKATGSEALARIVAPATEIVNSGDSKLITNEAGDVTSAGQELSDKLKDEAATPEEVGNAVQAGLTLDRETESAKQIQNPDLITNALNAVAPSVTNTGPIEVYQPGQALKPLINTEATTPTVAQYGMGKGPLSGLTPEEIQMYQAQTAAIPRKPLDLAIERLGVQDYFPTIGANTAVGSYSRKTLGSGNIYVAGGGVLPFGVLDARKRAMEKYAAEQKAIVDKIKDLNTDTADQYEQHFGDYVMDGLNGYIEAAGGDLSRLNNPSDPLAQEYNRFAKNVEGVRKEISDTDARVKQILEDQKAGRYVAPETLQFALEYSKGKWDFIDDFLTGKKKVSDYNSRLQSYDNITTFANESVERLSKVGPEERPLNLKEGIDPEKQAAEIQQAIIYKPGSSVDAWYTGVSKYFDTDKIKTYVDAAFDQNNFYKGLEGMTDEQRRKITEEGKASLASQIISQLSSQVSVKQELRDNDNLERAELELKRKRFEWEKDQATTKYAYVNGFGNTTQDYIKQINADPNLSPQQKSEKVAQLWTTQGNYNKGASDFFGTPANQIPMTDQEKNQVMFANKKDIKVRVKSSTGKYVETNLARIEDDYKKSQSQKGYKAQFDQTSYDFKVAVNDLSKMEKLNGGLGTGIPYNAKQRYQTVSVVRADGAVIPFNYSNNPNDQMINTVHSEINTSFNIPVMEDGVQKVNDKGEPVFQTTKLEGRYYTTHNLSDPTTQITLDTPMQTGQTNKNPNVTGE